MDDAELRRTLDGIMDLCLQAKAMALVRQAESRALYSMLKDHAQAQGGREGMQKMDAAFLQLRQNGIQEILFQIEDSDPLLSVEIQRVMKDYGGDDFWKSV